MSEQRPENPQLDPLTRTQVLVAMGVTAIILFVISKLWLLLGSITLIPLNFNLQGLIGGILLGLGITLASSIIYRIWPAYQRSADIYLEVVLKPLFWPDLIWLGLLPGLSEELLFRGVMLSALGVNPLGLIISSLCFGVLHLGGLQLWPYMVWATLVGFSLGYSVFFYDNLLVPIIAHILTNLLSSFIWKLEHNFHQE